MLEELKTILFSTAMLLLIFFYGHYALFRLLELFDLKTEKEDVIAFAIFIVIVSTYPAFVSKWIAKLLVKLSIFGWVIAAAAYVMCYYRFKKELCKKKDVKS